MVFDEEADIVTSMDGAFKPGHSVESVSQEIGRIVAARQELRGAGAAAEALEANRKRLAEAQAQLSRLLIERYLPQRRAA